MRAKVFFGITSMAVAAAMVTAVPSAISATSARQPAGSRAVGQSDAGVSSTALSSWQTDGIVFALAYGNGVVYAGGQFGNARPPGQPAGSTTGEVTRTFLAAFNSTTGALITSFDPTITETGTASRPGVYALALSPDGKTLYAGGTFNKVDGQSRSNLAAFDTSTGALTSWAPTSNSKVDAIAVSPSGSQIYVGGDLAHLDGGARTFAGAVDASGKLLPWAPALNSAVYTLAVTPDDSQVLIGGFFQTINGVSQNAAGAVDPTTGTTNVPWTANIVPYLPGTCTSAVKDIVISGGTAYISAEGNGGGCFDGDFAVSLGSTDSLLWQNVCLGATQALAVVNGWLFKGSHAHNCTFEAGGFPPVTKAPGEWVTWHLLDQSLTDGTIGHWTPSTNVGATEQGVGNLGPHAMATDGSQLFVGGDFTVVDNHAQQGFAIFPAGVDPSAPQSPSAAPTVTSTSAGVDSVSFPAVSSRDVGTLSYALYRDGTKIATLTATSWPWALPVLRYRDAGLAPGSRHTYTYTVNDGHHTTGRSSASAPVTVSATSPSLTYPSAVLHDSPSFYWRLGESSGTTAADRSGHGRSGIYEPGTTLGASGAITGGTNTAVSLDGKSDGYITSAKIMNNPQTFSMELWFKTTTDHGGRLIGFGNARTGTSSEYDRQIYMMNDGQLVFGVYHNGIQVIETTHVYNDGQWHYAVATLGSSGMRLYIDGSLAGTNTTSSAEAYNGYWRVGGDNLKGRWSLTPVLYDSQGATSPNSYYFAGTVDEVAVYAQALSAARVAAHYAANALSH